VASKFITTTYVSPQARHANQPYPFTSTAYIIDNQPALRIPALFTLFHLHSQSPSYSHIFLHTILEYINSSIADAALTGLPVRHWCNNSVSKIGPPISDAEKWVVCCCLSAPKLVRLCFHRCWYCHSFFFCVVIQRNFETVTYECG
jgi:hypothetical protein